MDILKQKITAFAAKALECDEADIDLSEDIQEMGFDSVKLTTFAEQLSASLDVELSPGLFFEYNTLGGIAEYLEEYHEDEVKMLLSE